MVMAVNEYLEGGWLAYLTRLRLREDRRFDPKDAQRMEAERKARMEAERKRERDRQQRRREDERQIKAFLEEQNQKLQLGESEFEFVLDQLNDSIGDQRDPNGIVADARVEWQRQQYH